MRRHHVRGFASRLFLVCAMVALAVYGQILGQVSGRIKGLSGAAIATARVTLLNAATNAARNIASTEDADYTFPSIPRSIYFVKAVRAGFRIGAANTLKVQHDLMLEAGQVTEPVEVTASAALQLTKNLAMGAVIEKELTELPLPGCNDLSLVALSACYGQAGSHKGGDRTSQSTPAAGRRMMFEYCLAASHVLNRSHWDRPSLILSGAAFPRQNLGVIDGTQTAMRQMQIGLKYSFQI